MDPVTAALNTISAFIKLQNDAFNALPPAEQQALAKQVYADLQAVKDLVQRLVSLVKG